MQLSQTFHSRIFTVSRLSYLDDLEEIEEQNALPAIRNMSERDRRSHITPRKKRPADRPSQAKIIANLAGQAEDQKEFDFTYHASRHERAWILDSLTGFHDGKWLNDILRLIQGGKEAHVYQCQANTSVGGLQNPYIAAKVYRPRRFRSLKNDHLYREGRQHLDADGNVVIDDGMLHAMAQRTGYGLELLHTDWIMHEYQALQTLHTAGADVPVPLVSGNNAILMAYVGGDETPAPTLNSIHLEKREAQRLFERVLHNIRLMLAQRCVHADLSAYNILYWEGEITLIDFPQAIDPLINRSAFAIFERDVRRVCEYFARQGIKSNPRRLASDLWRTHGYHISPEVHPALLDPEDRRDRKLWQNQDRK
jgi:RIO kinase 1